MLVPESCLTSNQFGHAASLGCSSHRRFSTVIDSWSAARAFLPAEKKHVDESKGKKLVPLFGGVKIYALPSTF